MPLSVEPQASRLRTIRRLALAATIATGVLLVVGATVSATGAGLACPDWPLCQAGWCRLEDWCDRMTPPAGRPLTCWCWR
jgi:heme A synthase